MSLNVDETWEVTFLHDNNDEQQLVSLLQSINRHLRNLNTILQRLGSGAISLSFDDATILLETTKDSIGVWEQREINTIIAAQLKDE